MNKCPHFTPDERLPRCKLDKTPCIYASAKQLCDVNPDSPYFKGKEGAQ